MTAATTKHKELIGRMTALCELNEGSFLSKGKKTHEQLTELIVLAEEARDEIETAKSDAVLEDAERARSSANRQKAKAGELVALAEKKLDAAEYKVGRANDFYETAKAQFGSVEEARGDRDDSHRELALLRVEVLGLARQFGFSASSKQAVLDANRAIHWLSENVKHKGAADVIAEDGSVKARLVHFRCLAELENAKDMSDVYSLVSEWQGELEGSA